ncbi:MAG: hypothetical protein HYV90_02285 [Candidatus Woesebacteria bacterium]|nr:MAG: hypothetical protein HYV90_02285 [Candidatus Woesebacteria bacterium]
MDKHLSFYITAFIFAVIGILLLVQSGKGNNPKVPAFVEAVQPSSSPMSLSIEEALSPDGKKILMMKQQAKDGVITYTFSVLTPADNSKKIVFTKTFGPETTLVIPRNTFSPDNKYALLAEKSGEKFAYFVIPLFDSPNFQEPLNLPVINDHFYTKYQDYKITDVTGWGGIGLVVVNTDMAAGGIGPSFWFDVSNSSFIMLSTRFN